MNKWIIPSFAALAGILASVFVYDSLPAEMAVHFNHADEPDNYIRKPIAAFLSPVLIVFIAWTNTLSMRFEKDENKRAKAEATLPTISAVVSLLLLAVHGAILGYNLGYDISPSSFVAFIVGSVFVVIGNLIPRMPQGSYNWPKLSDASYRVFARFLGRLMVIMGFVAVVAAFLPQTYTTAVLFLLLACFIVTMFAKLFIVARQS